MNQSRLTKISKFVIVIILFITGISIYIDRNINFNYVVEDYFPKKDENSRYFMDFLENFDNDVDYVIVALHNKNGIFDSTFLRKVALLTDTLKSSPYTRTVQSPTHLKNYIISPAGVFQVPYLHYQNPKKYKNDSIRIYTAKTLVGSFFSPDAKHLTLTINNLPNITPTQGDSLLDFINTTTTQFGFDDYRLMGRIKAQDYYKTQMSYEIVLFTLISGVLLIIYMTLIYRTFWSIAIALIVIGLSVVWTIALVLLIEGELNLMMTLLPVLLFVIGISDIVHILTKYIEELRIGKTKIKAIKSTFKEVGLATLLTSLTTAIGFISLAMNDAPPIQFFGIYTAIGVIITYIIAITLLPSILVLLKKPKLSENKNQQSILWNKWLRSLFKFTITQQKIIGAGTFIIILISGIGISQMKINNLFLEDLDQKSELKQDIDYFENNFAGIRPLEVGITLLDTTKSILDVDVIREINKVEMYLTQHYNAGFTISAAQILKSINQSQNGGLPEYFKLPESDKKLKKLIKTATKNKLFDRRIKIISKDKLHTRISTKSNDIGSYRYKTLNTNFNNYVLENTNTQLLEFRLTGVAHLLDHTNASIAQTLLEGLALAALLIAVIMGIVLKSFRMVIISLIPNLIPLLIIAGIMGFMEYDLKISTAIIFTIAFGICVDDTIHFLSKLKLELNKGKSVLYAMKRTYLSTGKAIILTSIILSSGFITFMFSDFASTVQVGLLISITLFFAVVSDLLVLPVLLVWFYKKKD